MILKPKSAPFHCRDMGVVKITSVYMLMGMLILISLYMKTCSIALLLVFPNLVTITIFLSLYQYLAGI